MLAWLEATGRIERDGEGELQLTGVCMDVSERHRLEEERRSSDEMLRNLIAASPLAIVSLDRDARVLLWNAAAEAMYGWRADEAIGRRLPTVPDAEWSSLERDLEAQFADRSQHSGTEVVRLRKDGTHRVFEPFFTTKEAGAAPASASYGIVTQSGGSITVESELGAGTTGTILLPEAPAPDRSRADICWSTVLLVEDEPLLRELVVEMLRSVSMNVLGAATADEAIERCAGKPFTIDELEAKLCTLLEARA